MKRPSSYQRPPQLDVQSLAQEAEYVGSPEHKIGRWWGGQGNPPGPDGALSRPKKQDTTVCPLRTQEDKTKATRWIQQALLDGYFVFEEGDKRFPKHVWCEDVDGGAWVGRCTNSVQGEYKGWPASPSDIASLERKKRRGA